MNLLLKKLKDMTIQRKLVFITMIVASGVLLLTLSSLAVYELVTFQSAALKQYSALADVVGNNTAAALAFEKPKDAERTLESLASERHVALTAIYDGDGKAFAGYAPGGESITNFPLFSSIRPGFDLGASRLRILRDVTFNSDRIGFILLEADLVGIYQRLVIFAVIAIGVFLGSVMLAWFLASKLQRLISNPVIHLLETARKVSASQNYSYRAVKESNDELGSLVDGFNHMLSRVELHESNLQKEISERKRIQNELVLAKEAAESASIAKSQFLATMSHEIRTPLNGIIGMSNLLFETPLSTEQKELAHTVKESGESLLGIINDILDFSKIEADKLLFERLRFDLRDVVEGVLDLVSEKACSKELEIFQFIDPQVQTRLFGDPGRIRQILLNLFSNGIKFTQAGEVSLNVQLVRDMADHAELRFSIKDTGIGISAEARKRLFQAFEQEDKSTTRRFGGTGLGLAISKKLVELMQGNIWCESLAGQGSTFFFTLRLEKQLDLPAEISLDEFATVQNLHLLLVDDNKTSVHIQCSLMQEWGMKQPCVAETAEEALTRLVKAAHERQPFDVVVINSRLNEIDNLNLVSFIKGDTGICSTKIILLKNLAGRFSSHEINPSHLAAMVTKPLKPSSLLQALKQAAARPGDFEKADATPPSKEPVASRPGAKALRILLAEDNVVNQKVASKQLQKLGYTVVCVGNGLEAVQALNEVLYDLVFMDCDMPEMDGFEATRRIRAVSRSKPVRIVAMTANAMQGDRERCLGCGMDDYISKPVRMEELQRVLEINP